MKEANPVKYFVARYFFLVLCLLQWLVAVMLYTAHPSTLKNQFASLIFFTVGALLFVCFLVINEKVRRVALSKKKIVVIQNGRKQRIEWSEVRSLTLVPFLNMYRLQLKGRKRGIYFFPTKNIDPAYGLLGNDTSKLGGVLRKLHAH